MKNTSALRARRAVRTAGPVAVTAVAAAAALLASGAAWAQAQTQGQADGQTVTVTGIRAAIESAITKKKEADSIVEAITAEDLGKLPEPSVADAMARLPGVAAQRNKDTGKAQDISVRGMSPDFNTGLLNGREVASSDSSRAIDFDLYPAELLNSVLVYKTPNAGLLGQGLSSTTDLYMIRPLDSKGRQVALNYRKQRTGIDNGVPNGEGSGSRRSFSYVDQFFDRTLGVALGAVKFTEEGAAQLRVNTWGGWTPTLNYGGQAVGVPGGFGRDIEFSNQEREGLMGVLQWKPNKNFETVLDVFQSKGRSANFKKGIEGFIGGSSDPSNYRGTPSLVSAVVNNGIATSGTIDNFKGVIRNHNEGADEEAKAWGLNARYKADGWTITGDMAQSKVVKNSARFETIGGLAGNGNPAQADGAPVTPGATGTISWTGFTGSNHGDLVFTPSTNFADRSQVKLTDVMGWGGGPDSPQAGYVAAPRLVDTVDHFKLSATRDVSLGPVSRIEAGLARVSREKLAGTQEGFLVIAGSADPYATVDIPGSGVLNVGGIDVATWDPRGSLGSIYGLRPNTYGAVINRNWGVKEDVTTGFVKADVDHQLFGLPLTGNFGAQLVRTQQRSSGFVNDSGLCSGATAETCQGESGGKSYSDVLPSLNLMLSLNRDTVARLGLARTMSRASMGDMRASIDKPSISVPTPSTPAILVSSGGNPDLEPFRATAFDLSFERYFGGNKGYVSLAGFYKDISTYILTLPQLYDFAGVLAPGASVPAAGTVGLLTRPTNGKGGSIQGVELAVNVPLSLLTPVLDGFGFSVNHSDTRSAIRIQPGQLAGLDVGSAFDIPLPGLSRRVTNLRVYYEKHGLQVAVASRARSDFLGQIRDYKDDAKITFIRGETVVDLQVSYQFPDTTPLKGLSLLFQGNNMTDTLFREYTTDRNSPTDTKRYGKTYLFGANYKF